MTIICIGDSHASFFSGLGTKNNRYMQPTYGVGPQINIISHFKGIRIGAATAYQLQRKIPFLQSIINKEYKADSDRILFCFGEVDCRLHLPKRIFQNKENKHKVVEECVTRYFNVILHFLRKNIKCAVWAVIGTNPPSLPYPQKWKVGSMEDRNDITILFNGILQERCKKHDIPFISIFDTMVKDEKTNPDFIMDHIHLSQNAMPFALKLFKDQQLI